MNGLGYRIYKKYFFVSWFEEVNSGGLNKLNELIK